MQDGGYSILCPASSGVTHFNSFLIFHFKFLPLSFCAAFSANFCCLAFLQFIRDNAQPVLTGAGRLRKLVRILQQSKNPPDDGKFLQGSKLLLLGTKKASEVSLSRPYTKSLPYSAALLFALLTVFSILPLYAAPTVVTTIRPFYSLVAGVMQGVGKPHLLIKGAQSPHTYALQPSQAYLLQEADLIVWGGPSLETFLSKSLAKKSFEAPVITLLNLPSLRLYPLRYSSSHSTHNHSQHPHDSHLKEAFDPHIWLDPRNAQQIVTALVKALKDLDPANAETYQTNGTRIAKRLLALDLELQGDLQAVKNKPYLSFHDSYQYFDRRYGLSSAGCITSHPENLLRPQSLQGLQVTIKERGVQCIFAEKEFPSSIVQMLAERTSVRWGVLDPLGAEAESVDENLYFSLMRNLTRSFISCLQTPLG